MFIQRWYKRRKERQQEKNLWRFWKFSLVRMAHDIAEVEGNTERQSLLSAVIKRYYRKEAGWWELIKEEHDKNIDIYMTLKNWEGEI